MPIHAVPGDRDRLLAEQRDPVDVVDAKGAESVRIVGRREAEDAP
jgi:3-dehydroquinate synthase class II